MHRRAVGQKYVKIAEAHIFETALCIFHTDVRTSVVLLLRGRIKSDAVIRNDDFIGVIGLTRRNSDRAALFLHAYTVLNGVFYDRLDAELRQNKVRCLNIIFHIQLIAEAELFDVQILLQMLKLLRKRNGLCLLQRIHIPPQVLGKCHRCLLRGLGIDTAHHRDRRQGVVHKVRLYLRYHNADLCLVQFLLHLLVADGFEVLLSKVVHQTYDLIDHRDRKSEIVEMDVCEKQIPVQRV